MDFSQTKSSLSLGFHSHNSSPSHRTPTITDNSISLQIDSTPSVPLQLLDDESVADKEKQEGDEEEQKDEEEFSILGHPMCLKRRREVDSSSSSSSSSSSKRVLNEQSLEARRASVRAWSNQPLCVADPDINEIMEKEKQRQSKGIELIASENFVCRAVMEALGSHLTNKYSEGMPGARYYVGNQYIDQIELLCCQRALTAFHLDSDNWGVNVQPYSCTSANFAVYTGLLLPKDRIMGLDSPSGGHLSHGYYTPNGKKVSGASIFFESFPYKVNPYTGYIDYDKLEDRALDFRPKILICGGSSYPREWDYARFRQIADKCGAVLMCDMAHISGLVAAKECISPFDYCDVVTSTTHKSLRGPRGGIVFYRKGLKPRKRGSLLSQGDDNDEYDFEERINFAVFPSLQGGPHNNHIAALAIALKQVATPEYKAYMQQVKRNAQVLASALIRRKCRLVTGGTDNHLVLWDLRNLGLTGRNYEKVCEMCYISLNKSAIFGDNGAISPGGVRIGTPAMTSRGCIEADFEMIADFLLRAAQIASIVQREHGKLQKDFLKGIQTNKDIIDLRNRVEGVIALLTILDQKVCYKSEAESSSAIVGYGDNGSGPLLWWTLYSQ
ncbi:Serine hydroxymethyltransferase [Macleaya cordata]|uniref:Serine hydroxymethyltransferase n=1 Tax=Macleaya cordata TaxID=56857 RepID=A0A200Q6P7_MACCD|nr:Serine hydroxymethyltransferase [Macleaya cordata]